MIFLFMFCGIVSPAAGEWTKGMMMSGQLYACETLLRGAISSRRTASHQDLMS